jgi:hypothetical protein
MQANNGNAVTKLIAATANQKANQLQATIECVGKNIDISA